jgi:hypothetical protein
MRSKDRMSDLGPRPSDSLVQRGHSVAGILWTLSAEVLHHSCNAKHDGGEQNCDDDRGPIGRARGHETWNDNKERGGKAGHCQPLLEKCAMKLECLFLQGRVLAPARIFRLHAQGDWRGRP